MLAGEMTNISPVQDMVKDDSKEKKISNSLTLIAVDGRDSDVGRVLLVQDPSSQSDLEIVGRVVLLYPQHGDDQHGIDLQGLLLLDWKRFNDQHHPDQPDKSS